MFGDQEGCELPATWIHKRNSIMTEVQVKKTAYQFPEFRLFCNRHQNRGDCGIDDADSNYDKAKLDNWQSPTD